MAFASYPSLKDRVVFITGGASGIGASFVEQFAAQGARVAFVDLQADAGETLAANVGGRFERCDVTDAEALQAAIGEATTALGPITVLVNNVANDARHDASGVTPDSWRKALAVNLDPVMTAAVAVYPRMREAGGGSIINVSSINALWGPAHMPAYVAAKGAINSLTKGLAREWGPDRIRVNALSPGWVVTERQLELWLTPDAEADWRKQVALKDRIEPDDIARAALFLASDESRMMTGQNLIVDAGRV